jgi:NTP pyrophosphatase (non-canonical NTP hydrolase)
MYYIYHIPGKKIGVTRNLNSRVTEQQGYASDEYEVLLTSDDIEYVSTQEIELQKTYGYKVDRQSYKNLINKNKQMKLNSTEQTTTFPVPLNKLKGNLMDNLGMKWDTDHGVFGLDDQTVQWICKNAKVSMFNVNRCYIYNKAYALEFLESKVEKNKPNIYDLIRTWATEKGIYKSGDARTQYLKLMEEAGELAEAILKNDEPEVIDAIGDMVVVLTNLAKLIGHNIEDCVTSAYNVIKSRQGSMVNGTFVKDVVGNAAATFTLNHTSNKFNNFSTNTL